MGQSARRVGGEGRRLWTWCTSVWLPEWMRAAGLRNEARAVQTDASTMLPRAQQAAEDAAWHRTCSMASVSSVIARACAIAAVEASGAAAVTCCGVEGRQACQARPLCPRWQARPSYPAAGSGYGTRRASTSTRWWFGPGPMLHLAACPSARPLGGHCSDAGWVSRCGARHRTAAVSSPWWLSPSTRHHARRRQSIGQASHEVERRARDDLGAWSPRPQAAIRGFEEVDRLDRDP